MKTYQAADIRNFAVVGHATSGKTLLCEAMLATAGEISRMGSIAAGSTWLNPDANVTKADPAFAPEILQPGAANSIRPEKGGDPTPDHPMQKLGPAWL